MWLRENRPGDAETLIIRSRKLNMQKSDSAPNVLLPDSFRDGIEMETEQSDFKVPSKRKTSDEFQKVRAKKADVEDCYGESASDSSDSSVSLSQGDFSSRGCEVDDIKLFFFKSY